jgi:hypothetical protein
MVDGNRRHRLRIGKPEVHRNAPPPACARGLGAPPCHASTLTAEVKLYRLAANVDVSIARHLDAFTFKIVCPEGAVAATYGAITGRGRFRHSRKSPVKRSAVAGSFKHAGHQSTFDPFGEPDIDCVANILIELRPEIGFDR